MRVHTTTHADGRVAVALSDELEYVLDPKLARKIARDLLAAVGEHVEQLAGIDLDGVRLMAVKSIKEVARDLSLSEETVRRYCKWGYLPATRIGPRGRWKIDTSSALPVFPIGERGSQNPARNR